MLLRRPASDRSYRVVAVGERLPFCDAQFDGVFSINVLEHVADLAAVLSESARVLEDGGIWLAITPNGNWEHLLDLAERWSLKIPEGPHRFLTTRMLREGVIRHFELLNIERSSFFPLARLGCRRWSTGSAFAQSGVEVFFNTLWHAKPRRPTKAKALFLLGPFRKGFVDGPGNLLAPPRLGRMRCFTQAMRSIADRERVSDRYWTHHDKLNELRIWWRRAPRGTCFTCCRAKRSWSWAAARAR